VPPGGSTRPARGSRRAHLPAGRQAAAAGVGTVRTARRRFPWLPRRRRAFPSAGLD